jgi:hypothetical protein
VWVIYNPNTNTVAGLTSDSPNNPSMPSGYTAKARVGWAPTDNTARYHRFIQRGRRAQYKITAGSPTSNFRIVTNGAGGGNDTNTPTFVNRSLANLVPSTASRASFTVTNSDNGAGPHATYIAPNNDYRGPFTPAPPPIYLNAGGGVQSVNGEFELEALSIGYVGSGGGSAVYITGWEDNL